jgi:glycosyltransferase involved in cell wall biosynthesis
MEMPMDEVRPEARATYEDRPPRVLHLSTYDAQDGAARGSTWLNEALKQRVFESSLMVGRKLSNDPAIRPLPGLLAPVMSALRMKFDRIPLRAYRKTDEAFWTVGWLPCRIDRLLPQFDADIVHLHWVGAGFLSISTLKHFRCPVVWTLRDMWAFTGGCHYAGACDRYREACGACPQLRSTSDADLSRAIWTRKQKHWHGIDLWLVAISEWLANCVRSSELLRAHPLEVIPNGVDTARFHPTERAAARQAWDLPLDRQIIVYGAMRARTDPRKGYPQLEAAVEKLRQRGRTENLMLVVFGDPQMGALPKGIDGRNVGFLNDDQRLSLLYSAADVAVVPSIQEAFGKTVIEAMACCTPVVAFDVGGPKDIIDHLHDGFLAQPYRSDDLAKGIGWCLEQMKLGPDLGRRARTKVETKYDIDVIAGSYESLYRRILTQARERTGR